jgi:hypothetical protein
MKLKAFLYNKANWLPKDKNQRWEGCSGPYMHWTESQSARADTFGVSYPKLRLPIVAALEGRPHAAAAVAAHGCPPFPPCPDTHTLSLYRFCRTPGGNWVPLYPRGVTRNLAHVDARLRFCDLRFFLSPLLLPAPTPRPHGQVRRQRGSCSPQWCPSSSTTCTACSPSREPR